MLSEAKAVCALLSLLFIMGVNTEENALIVVANCYERIEVCNNLAKTNVEVIAKQEEFSKCIMDFMCKAGKEEDDRLRALVDYGNRIAMAEADPDVLASFYGFNSTPRNTAVTFSVTHKTLVLSALAVMFLAYR